MPTLIHQIQKPPIERIGILDLETVFPAEDRLGLAMRLNNLLASPGFSAWLEGDPLDIGKMLRSTDGRPRLSIVSIAHLSDPERMFVVTMVLNQLIAWMRTQSGSRSMIAELTTVDPPRQRPCIVGMGAVPSTMRRPPSQK